MLCTDACTLSVIISRSSGHLYLCRGPLSLGYIYDLRSVNKQKTILHQVCAVVADYINAFVE